MGRRGENIRKRKDGRWEARIICGYDYSGKAKYRSVYGKSYQEVREKRNALAAVGFPGGNHGQDYGKNKLKITFQQLMLEWLDSKKDSVKESTFARYTDLLERQLFPELGNCPLPALTAEQLDHFLREKLRSGRLDGTGGLSPKTVADLRSVLLLGLEYARQRHYPCGVDRKLFYPRIQRTVTEVLTREEQAKLEKVLFSHPTPLKLGILAALYGGLRIGEVCALQWGDFQFESGTVQVSRTMLRVRDLAPDAPKKTKILIDRPKTESSIRIIPMPSFIIALFKEYQMAQDAYVLTGTQAYLEPRICLDQYKKVLKEAGLRPCTFHALRHTFATRCVESGFDPKSLSEILGHANVSTTLQRYVHPSIELKREQMERLEKISVRGQDLGQEGAAKW